MGTPAEPPSETTPDNAAGAAGPPSGPTISRRANVALLPDAAQALMKLVDRTGQAQTDIINRALPLYEFIDAEIRAGGQLAIRPPNGAVEVIRIF